MFRIQNNENSSLLSILRHEVEQTLKLPIEIIFYTGSLKDALAKDSRVRKDIDLVNPPPVGFILSESMLLLEYKTLKICYIIETASQQIKIHELYHFITPFIAPSLPKNPTFDQLVEHHTLIALDEFWADYQSVLFLNKYGILLVEDDVKKRGLFNGENIGRHLIEQFFNRWRDFKRDHLRKKTLFSLIIDFFRQFKQIIYLLGMMRGSFEVGDNGNMVRFQNVWSQLLDFILDWSNWEQIKTDFHPKFIILLRELHACLIEVNLPQTILELSYQLNPSFKHYIYEGLIPSIYPQDQDNANRLLREDSL